MPAPAFRSTAALAPTRPDTTPVPQLIEAWLERLLQALRWRATVLHAGRYCGSWQASTAGRQQASFHWVLQGRCWLHRPGQPSLLLNCGEGLFFLKDEPHRLSPFADANEATQAKAMQPAGQGEAQASDCVLACGFLHFESALAPLLLAALPGSMLLCQGKPESQACARLLPMMLDEARLMPSAEEPSLVMQRLADLLFMLCLRAQLGQALATGAQPQLSGLWSMATEISLLPLMVALLQEPAADWTAERMAAQLHVSRASFFRLFTQTCGQTPAQFLLELRMQLATQHLQQGESISRAAEQVGYQSSSAFSRAYRKVTGDLPGRFRHARKPPDNRPD